MKHLKLYENFVKRLYHRSVGGKSLPPIVKESMEILSAAYIDFFSNIDYFKDEKIVKKIDYSSAYEHPRYLIKVLDSSFVNNRNIMEFTYYHRRIPPEVSVKYFGKQTHRTIEVDEIKIFESFYTNQHDTLEDIYEYLLSIKYKFSNYSDQIRIDQIPDLIKELNVDDFNLYLNMKKYNL